MRISRVKIKKRKKFKKPTEIYNGTEYITFGRGERQAGEGRSLYVRVRECVCMRVCVCECVHVCVPSHARVYMSERNNYKVQGGRKGESEIERGG